ncbi:cellulose biosynthesis protein BcsE [Neisseriaceae bacterium TC5R-5]|nr:cellulose biosynthesis protein BcsE [Neisseriaceae bacterium TC5R-5]
MQTVSTLGITGLSPAAGGMHPGAIYLVMSHTVELTQALLFANLPLDSQISLIIASAKEPASACDTDCLDQRLHHRSILLFSARGRGGARHLLACLDELARCQHQLPAASDCLLLVLDNAEDYLPLADALACRRRLALCQRWAEQHGHIVLLLVEAQRLSLTQNQLLTEQAKCCAGLVHAQYAGNELYNWQVLYWEGEGSVLKPTIYSLELNKPGQLRLFSAGQAASLSAQASQQAADWQQVFATRVSLADNATPSSFWQVFDDLEDLFNMASSAISASILLDSTSKTGKLAPLIQRLRQHCGAQLKILVREVGNSRLRHNEEQLLLRLGANAVLPAELRFTSVLNVLQGLQQAVYQTHRSSPEQELQQASEPEHDRGYLPPARFVEVVRQAVKRSRHLDIHNVMLRLRPAPGASPLDLLRLSRFKRAGDLCTADQNDIYLFLFACRESDVDAALPHLFRLPINEIISFEVRTPDSDGIQLSLERLAEQAGFAELPDLGAVLLSETTSVVDSPQPAHFSANWPGVPVSARLQRR